MTLTWHRWNLPLIAALSVGGCVFAPVDPYYEDEVVIVAPPPRVEYRGYPPVVGYVWIDGYWNWTGRRHDWMPGYWSAPHHRHPSPPRQWQREHDRERALRRELEW